MRPLALSVFVGTIVILLGCNSTEKVSLPKGASAFKKSTTPLTNPSQTSVRDHNSSTDLVYSDYGINWEIPDNDTFGIHYRFFIGSYQNFEDLEITLGILHPYIGDLKVTLIHPNGTSVLLQNREGGNQQDLIASFTLDNFLGFDPYGEWELWVQDLASSDVGELDFVELRLNSATFEELLPPQILAASPQSYSEIDLDLIPAPYPATGMVIKYIQGSSFPSDCYGGISIGITYSYTVQGLLSDTLYSFAVCSTDLFGTQSSPALVQARTRIEPAPATPTGLTVSTVSYRELQVSFQSGGGTSHSFILNWRTGSVPPSSCIGGTNIGDQTSYLITGLSPEQDYSFAICAINHSGIVSPSVFATGRTGVEPLAPEVGSLTATPINSSKIELSWNSSGGTTSSFLVSSAAGNVAPNNCFGGRSVALNSIAPQKTLFTGLNSATTYSFRVCAINSSNRSSVGTGVTQTTKSIVPLKNLVAALYQDLYKRTPSPSEIDPLAYAIDEGLSFEAAALTIINSTERRSHLVTEYYRHFLNREPDPTGLSHWVNVVAQGLSHEEVMSDFMGSPEYFAKGGNTNSGWVHFLYQDILGRQPDPAGQTLWVNQLNSGVPRSAVALGFIQNPEYRRLYLKSRYQDYLCREADEPGIQYWLDKMAQGVDRESAVAGIVASQEYFDRAQLGGCTSGTDSISPGLPPPNHLLPLQKYVTTLYQDIVLRTPSSDEVNYWVYQLSGGLSRTEVSKALLGSEERRSQLVTGYYQHFLYRNPEPAGLAHWVGILGNATPQDEVIASFMGSAEYFAKGGNSHRAWVEFLYTDILGRSAEPAGLDHWTAQLDAGASRSEIAKGFIQSNEYRRNLVKFWYSEYLCRVAEEAGIQYWVNQLNSGSSRESIEEGIFSSQEYFDLVQMEGNCSVGTP